QWGFRIEQGLSKANMVRQVCRVARPRGEDDPVNTSCSDIGCGGGGWHDLYGVATFYQLVDRCLTNTEVNERHGGLSVVRFDSIGLVSRDSVHQRCCRGLSPVSNLGDKGFVRVCGVLTGKNSGGNLSHRRDVSSQSAGVDTGDTHNVGFG